MATLNVNREVDDPFYRYKMPPLIAKVEGKGNGIKTVIVNMTDIAKSLARSPSYVTKFFGCELGAQTQMEHKNDRYIVNGAHQASDLQNLLDGFIKKFVLCLGCANPETVLAVSKKKDIDQDCKACGFRRTLPPGHRLITYILNNPPNPVDTKKKMSKAERRAAKEAARANSGSSPPSTPKDDKDMSAAVAGEVATEEDADWSVDTSAEAVSARAQEQLSAGVAGLAMTDDLERSPTERLEIFFRFVQAQVRDNKFVAKEIVGEADRLDCKDKGVMVLVEVLFDAADIVGSIQKYAALLQRFAESKKSQKYLLGALEKLIERHSDLLAKVPHVFKKLYDMDIVDEAAFISWGEKVSKKYVSKDLSQTIHDKAEPFINWLKEADEESSDEEEDDDDVPVTFDSAAAAAVEQEQAEKKAAAAQASEEDDDDDDIDIDAI